MLDKFKTSKTYKVVNSIASNAILALLLTFVFFAYDEWKDNRQDVENQEQFSETVDRLEHIQHALSTRFLGTFPNYLTEINNVFANLQPQDTVIIFEDVLYYGIKSRPKEFRAFNEILIRHALHGGAVKIVYYDNHPQNAVFPWDKTFYRMVMESRIAMSYVPMVRQEHRARMNEASDADKMPGSPYPALLDSALTEKYFRKTCAQDRKKAEAEIQSYLDTALIHVPDSAIGTPEAAIVHQMCLALDSIKQANLGHGKKLDDVHFADYVRMYSDMTDCIAACYKSCGIDSIVPINEYLTMSCWLIKPADTKNRATEAILAFPSKYASDEIGFYSQDASFAKYITTVWAGICGSNK